MQINILNIYSDYVGPVHDELTTFITSQNPRLSSLFKIFSKLCKTSKKPIVLLVDEVDNASNNQVAGMLAEYEKDYHTGMDIDEISNSILCMDKGWCFTSS